MRHIALLTGLALALASTLLALTGHGMTLHMTAHMIAVAIAAPLVAIGVAGTACDPVRLVPRLAQPIPAMLVELILVWGWHVPAARRFADASTAGTLLEQATFLAAGLLLWSAVLGTRAMTDRRASGIAALLLTSMHMTLLAALIGLAPRPLYPVMAMHAGSFGLDALADQQLGGVVMLAIGGVSYMAGGLAMLAGLLRLEEIRP